MKNLLGETLITEENITFLYKGDSFSEGRVLLKSLHTELKSLESLIRDSVDIFVKNGKLGKESKDFEIFIEIEKGSINEKIKIVFNTPMGVTIFTTIIAPFIMTTYTHFLNGRNTPSNNEFYTEVKTIENNETFKSNLIGILAPLNKNNDTVLINTGTINVTVNYDQKKEIEDSLSEAPEEIIPLKNGEYSEVVTGVIRKIDLDAGHQNYLGFNIDNGPSRVPTSIKGPFNLLDYKELIDTHIKVVATVRYKDDAVIHIQIENVEVLEQQQRFEME